MKIRKSLYLILLSSVISGYASMQTVSETYFEKRILANQYFCDGIQCGDINNDTVMDIVAGPYWYEGPDFVEKHEYYPAVPFPTEPSPTNCMFVHVYDFNSDGWNDILVLGRVHLHSAYWYENPKGAEGNWKKHYVFERVKGETPPFVDITGDGKPELIAHWEGRFGWIQPDWRHPEKSWTFHPITRKSNWNQFYHGTGVGDINGDGRQDLLLNHGWWEHPVSLSETWIEHPYRFAQKGGAQIYAFDVDGDGDSDVISSLDAHGWGLAWFEQVKSNGIIEFREHKLMGDRSEEDKYGVCFSQPHALDIADLNGDGLLDIVIGKRLWAHGPTGDIEPNAPAVLYWFQQTRNKDNSIKFIPCLIDSHSGVGVQVTAADVTGDAKPDILTVSKLGTFLFVNQ